MRMLKYTNRVIARKLCNSRLVRFLLTKQSFYWWCEAKYNEIASSNSSQCKFHFRDSSQKLPFAIPRIREKRSRFIRALIQFPEIASLRSQIILIVLLGIFFTSCSIESLPINVEPAEEKIAVASLIGPEETFFITLSRSFSALSAEDVNDLTEDAVERLLLDQALVLLEYDGITDTLEKVFDINGLYGTQLQSFDDFQLMSLTVFDSSTSETVTSQSMLLPQIELDSVTVTRDSTRFEDVAVLTFNVIDRPEENFFVVQAYQLTDSDTTTSDSTGSSPFFDNDTFLIYEGLFTDRGVDEDGVIRREELINFTSETDSALVIVTNISEGYYRFLEARNRSGGLVSSLANEPVNHPTNIQNGVGYFSAHRPRAVLVVVE